MDNRIPIEIFEKILLNVAEYTHPTTERFPTFTAASKRGILSARAVWGNYRRVKPLRQLFVSVLEQMPFTVSGPEDERGRISGLEALAKSEYAQDMTTLSFCPMVYNKHLSTGTWPPNTEHVLESTIRRLSLLEHVRYYTLPPNYVQGRLLDDDDTHHSYVWEAQAYDPDRTPPHVVEYPEVQAGNHHFGILQHSFRNSKLKSFTTPYNGNLASFCTLHWQTTIETPFSASLRRISINLVISHHQVNVFDSWVFMCPNLEYLEIALCRPHNWEVESQKMLLFWIPEEWRHPDEKPPLKLTEVRLIGDTDTLFDSRQLLSGLHRFPALKKLALAHVQMRQLPWPMFFDDLRNTAKWKVYLDTLWLLNPTTCEATWPVGPYVRFMDEKAAVGAAKEVKIVHTPWPWGKSGSEEDVMPGQGRGSVYERFEVFEEMDGGSR